METETSTIELPPPRRKSPGSGRSGSWLVWVAAALIAGVAVGVLIGKRLAGESPKPDQIPIVESETASKLQRDREIKELLQKARDAVDRADWVEIRDHYSALQGLDPENPLVKAALPLINLHMDEARGGLIVKTIPEGATVRLGSFGEEKSLALFNEVPFGTYTMEINLEGYEPHVEKVKIGDKAVREMNPIQLVRSSGSLTLSSEPNGVEFQLVRTDGLPTAEEMEVIEIGKTPALIEKLDPGEYQVNMALKGWPGFTEEVIVEHNRKSSVSHVFARGGLNITSDPDGAEIYLTTESSLGPEKMETTPEHLEDLPVGRHRLELRYKDWPPIQRMVEVSEGEDIKLHFEWPRSTIAFSSDPPGAEVWRNDRRIGQEEDLRTPFTMEFPEGEYTFVARYEDLTQVIEEIEVSASEAEKGHALNFGFEYGSIVIESKPPGAAVLRAGVPLGRTPFSVNHVRPGLYSYQIKKPQHKDATVSGEVNPGQSLKFDTRLVFDPAPHARSDFENSLKMKMVWVNSLKGWVGAHEVDQKAFETLMNKNPSEFKGDDLPVHGVSWGDANSFCKVLNSYADGQGRLPKGYEYQIPTDAQWSEFVGDAAIEDAITSRSVTRSSPEKIGSSLPNEYGLFDVRGNVWEWCDDWLSQTIVNRARADGSVTPDPSWIGTERKVLRGGSWSRSTDNDLDIGYRHGYGLAEERRDVGFRVVLMPK